MVNKPTVKELIAALKEFNGLEIAAEDITEEIYENATRGHERGVSLKSMANRVRFYLVGKKNEVPKETTKMTGVFVGSKDRATEAKPLGKNKVQDLSFLVLGDDEYFRVLSDPSPPSHFKGFKKKVFGAYVEADFAITKTDKNTYVSPENVTVLDNDFKLDTGKIKVYDITALPELEDYTACAVVGKLSSIKPSRVPVWEEDKYESEEYPLVIKGNPVFTVYLNAEEGEPIIKGMVHPTNLAKPYITLEDFDAVWPKATELEGLEDGFVREEITPMFNDVEVILIGQKKRAADVGDKVFVDFEVNAILAVGNAPSVIEVASGVKRAKSAKNAIKSDKAANESNDKKKQEVRQAKVAAVVTAMRDATTVKIVQDMNDAKFFKGVDDAAIQKMINKEFDAQDIKPVDDSVKDSSNDESSDENTEDDVWGDE